MECSLFSRRRLAELRARASKLAAPLRQPIVAFGLTLAALIWIGSETLINLQRESVHADILGDARNLSIILDREVVHTIEDLDRILMFLRWTHDHNERLDWSSIVTEKYTVDSEAVQIAVTDAKGVMLASSAMPHPTQKVDLSDREHFRVQLNSTRDDLFISKPLTGRASGKPSVQFSRRLTDAKGAFAGVIVISLDPAMLMRAYSHVDLGVGYGLALIGDDGVLRSGAGVYEDLLGRQFPGSENLAQFFQLDTGSTVAIDRDDAVEVVRAVEGFPLNVVVKLPGIAANGLFASSAENYRLIAAAVSILALLATAGAALRRHRYERRILHMAKYDALTNLPNRTQIRDHLDAIVRLPADKRNFALHIVDLDGFKMVNDTYGHLKGDELLKLVAQRLSAVADAEIVGRLGGDEFVVIQPIADFDGDARSLAQKMIARLSEPCRIGDIDASVTASVGIASARYDGNSASELLQAADLALYAAKTMGRRGFCRYDESMMRQMRNRVAVEAGLRRAIERGEFELHYQPIISLLADRIVAFEALVRWNHPERGLIGPGEFISVAEETGMIVAIGEWVMRKACQDVARLGGDLRVAVNCSPRQFAGPGIVAAVRSALADSGLSPDRLEIEITESMLLKEDQQVSRQLTELRSLGSRISMDDFGTGYSSLSYLQRYPIDRIKIDRSFIASIAEQPQTQAVVRAIIDLATAFNIHTIAEGVETDEQLQMLRRLGGFEVQGYLFSRPKPIEEFLAETGGRGASLAA